MASPQFARAKINVDGGLSRDGRRGAAVVVCRNNMGNYSDALFVFFDGLMDAPTLETHACNEAIYVNLDLNLQSVQVDSHIH